MLNVFFKCMFDIILLIRHVLIVFFKGDFRFLLPLSKKRKKRKINILGNSPMLSKTIKSIEESDHNIMVNFALCDDLFFVVKPEYLSICDPIFFVNDFVPATQERTKKLKDWHENLKKIDWNLTLIIPSTQYRNSNFLRELNLEVVVINARFFDVGSNFIRHKLYQNNLSCPNLSNIIILAIYSALQLNYENVYIHGVDGDGFSKYRVDMMNHISFEDTHYYNSGIARNLTLQDNVPIGGLYKCLLEEASMHRSFLDVSQYAKRIGVKVYNVSPNSMLDTFEKINLQP